jgi:hypothetical protein
MGAYVSIPKQLLYDETLRDVDLRLYLIIAECVNEHGYSEITNAKLAELTGKDKRSIQRTLKSLADAGHIQIKEHVKENDIYNANIDRVIWLEEFYARYKRLKKIKPKKATIENNYQTFTKWLRTQCIGIEFNVKLDGVTQTYSVANDHYLKQHKRGAEPKMLRRYESNDIYKVLWSNREVLIPDIKKKLKGD